jgi:hypothetical protein
MCTVLALLVCVQARAVAAAMVDADRDTKTTALCNTLAQHDLRLAMSTTSRIKIEAKAQLTGGLPEGFQTLKAYLDKVKQANPGTLTAFEQRVNGRFHRAFISLGQCQVRCTDLCLAVCSHYLDLFCLPAHA